METNISRTDFAKQELERLLERINASADISWVKDCPSISTVEKAINGNRIDTAIAYLQQIYTELGSQAGLTNRYVDIRSSIFKAIKQIEDFEQTIEEKSRYEREAKRKDNETKIKGQRPYFAVAIVAMSLVALVFCSRDGSLMGTISAVVVACVSMAMGLLSKKG